MAKRKGGVQKVSRVKRQESAPHKRVHPGKKQPAKAKNQQPKTRICSREEGAAVCYDEYQRILCIGEGNFSFARALVRKLEGQGRLLTATAYDTKETVWEKYEVSCMHNTSTE